MFLLALSLADAKGEECWRYIGEEGSGDRSQSDWRGCEKGAKQPEQEKKKKEEKGPKKAEIKQKIVDSKRVTWMTEGFTKGFHYRLQETWKESGKRKKNFEWKELTDLKFVGPEAANMAAEFHESHPLKPKPTDDELKQARLVD